MMHNFRKYGTPPFQVAVIHGGPGAPGDMASIARELSQSRGVLEPLQTAQSVEGQCQELRTVIEHHAKTPVILIGHSWGAWLSFIFAAHYPLLVKKLILISSGPFEEKYTENLMQTRLNRLTEEDRQQFDRLKYALNESHPQDHSTVFAQFGKLMSKADSYYEIPHTDDILAYQHQTYLSVWQEATQLRKSGNLLNLGKRIQCPLIAIQGDYDSHPAEGVKVPLSAVVKDFRFVLLKKCGHYPWFEKEAREEFYTVLKNELH